ncbi:MAG: hypothetical protein U5L10_01380 [Candidatus Moranbacteria bacterium]|nr:hypothetical protein [Candidatus Moranbacteria bacterium]
MKSIKLNIIEIVSIWWISVAVFSLAAVILGIFRPELSLVFAGLIALLILKKIKDKKISPEKLSGFSYLVIAFFLLMAVFLSFNTQPTIFGGRDEGSYSNSAILMNKSSGMTHESQAAEEFFEIYGEGKALNFPGFQYTEEGSLKSQFLPGYPAWLASFYGLFGVQGFAFANLFPFMTFVLSVYFILLQLLKPNKTFEETLEGAPPEKGGNEGWYEKVFGAEQLAFLGALTLATFFAVTVFYKFTLSEIYFGSLVWFILLMAVKYFRTKSFAVYKLMFLPAILLPFVRIEAAAFIFLLLLIMILKDFNHLRQAKYQFFFVLSGLALFISIAIMPNFFIDSIKNLAEISFGSESAASAEGGAPIIPDDWQNFYLLKVFYNYNLIPFILMSVFAVFYIFKRRKFFDKKADKKFNSLLLMPVVFTFPTLIYFIDANISLDHPWMLRRYIFTVLPLLAIYSMLFLKHIRFRNKILFNLIAVFVVLGNLVLLLPSKDQETGKWHNFLTFKQNEGLAGETARLAKNFQEDDLILISQKSSGSQWSLISAPLRNLAGLNAVYFFNPEDLEEIGRDDYENVYLLTSKEELGLYKELEKEKVKDYRLSYPIIKPSRDPMEKPRVEKIEVEGGVYKINE